VLYQQQAPVPDHEIAETRRADRTMALSRIIDVEKYVKPLAHFFADHHDRCVRTGAVLVAVNLLPLALVALGVWDLRRVMLLYWMENGIIGLFNLARLLLARYDDGFERVFLPPFFLLHYGAFFLGHGMLLAMWLGFPVRAEDFSTLLALAPHLPWVAVLAYCISHGYSFVRHYLHGGERESEPPGALMFRPYGRVLVLHLTLLGAGFALMRAHEPHTMLMLLVIFKIALDLAFHVYSHRRRCRVA